MTTNNWNDHWMDYSEALALNPAQAYRRHIVFDVIRKSAGNKPIRLLDAGCGQGDLGKEFLAEFPGAAFAGVDESSTGLAIAQKQLPTGMFFQTDLSQPHEPPPQLKNWATHIVAMEVLEHVENPVGFLRNLKPYGANDGTLLITVPGGPQSAFDRHIGHRRHFSLNDLRNAGETAGLYVTSVEGRGFPFFNLYRLTVIARGEKLVEEMTSAAGRPLPLFARIVMRLFGFLFRLNVDALPWGWQRLAIFKKTQD